MAFLDVVARLRGRTRAPELPVSPLPHSLVTVLDDETELRAAINRAMTFERSIASRAAGQLARYEEMVAPPPRLREVPAPSEAVESPPVVLRELA